jgi:type I restriction enzyme, S subunit
MMTQYPKEWAFAPISDFAFVKGGKRLPKGEKLSDAPSSFPYIRVTDFKNFSVRLSDIKYLRPETRESIKRYTISANDIYISIAGTIGLTGRIPHELEGANLTENAAKIVMKANNVDASYVMFYLASDFAQREIKFQTVKNAQPKLALIRIQLLKVPLPPLHEQHRIAYVLNTVQTAIERQARLIKLIRELKSALMRKLFTEGLRGEKQKETEIGLVPESWDVLPLYKVSKDDFQNGAFIKNPVKGKGLLFANVVDMYNEVYLDFQKLERIDVESSMIQQYLLEENDVLVVRSSLKREGIGQNSVVKNLKEPVFLIVT